jgi:hypothetical protein
MNNHYEQSPRFSAVGVTTGSILALIVAMAISVVLDVHPANGSVHASAGQTVSTHA